MKFDFYVILPVMITCFFGLLAYLLKYWFEKLNKSQEIIIADMKVLMEHKYTSTAKIDTMRENWQDMQKKMLEEIKEMNDYCSNSFDKINIKIDRNILDIQNIKSEQGFFAQTLKALVDDRKKSA